MVNIEVIKWIPTYNEDELITGHNADFMKDKKFIDAYNSAVHLALGSVHWRAYVICWAAEKAKYLTDIEIENKGQTLNWDYGASYEGVKEVFKEFSNVKIIQGSVPETLPQVKSSKISFLSIDMNCVIPEIVAAEFFWDKLISGGVMVLDDYGHSGHEEQKKAFDDFSIKKNIPILCLPTGQGLIFKP